MVLPGLPWATWAAGSPVRSTSCAAWAATARAPFACAWTVPRRRVWNRGRFCSTLLVFVSHRDRVEGRGADVQRLARNARSGQPDPALLDLWHATGGQRTGRRRHHGLLVRMQD